MVLAMKSNVTKGSKTFALMGYHDITMYERDDIGNRVGDPVREGLLDGSRGIL